MQYHLPGESEKKEERTRIGRWRSCARNSRWRRKAIFLGKVKRKKKEHEEARTEDETENDAPDDEVEGGGRACRQKGWWKRGDVEAKLNTVNMMA